MNGFVLSDVGMLRISLMCRPAGRATTSNAKSRYAIGENMQAGF